MNGYYLIELAQRYGENQHISHWAVSARCTSKGDFFARLSRGSSCTMRTYARIVQWFSDRWPEGLAWPSDIPRPPPSSDSPAALAAAVPPAPPPPIGDLVEAVRAAQDRMTDALGAGDWTAMAAAENDKFAAGMTLRADGRLASPEALCSAIGVGRHVYDYVVARYRDDVNGRRRARKNSDAEKMLVAIAVAGDARFAQRRARKSPLAQGLVDAVGATK